MKFAKFAKKNIWSVEKEMNKEVLGWKRYIIGNIFCMLVVSSGVTANFKPLKKFKLVDCEFLNLYKCSLVQVQMTLIQISFW